MIGMMKPKAVSLPRGLGDASQLAALLEAIRNPDKLAEIVALVAECREAVEHNEKLIAKFGPVNEIERLQAEAADALNAAHVAAEQIHETAREAAAVLTRAATEARDQARLALAEAEQKKTVADEVAGELATRETKLAEDRAALDTLTAEATAAKAAADAATKAADATRARLQAIIDAAAPATLAVG